MKKLLIMLFALGLTLGAAAQSKGGHFRPTVPVRSHVVVVGRAYAPYYPYYGYDPFWGYPYYGSPYAYPSRPTRLDLRVADIRNDYQQKIWAARHDKSVARSQRRANIHELKHERDAAIIDARRNYYKK